MHYGSVRNIQSLVTYALRQSAPHPIISNLCTSAQCATPEYQLLMHYSTLLINKWRHSAQPLITNKICTTALFTWMPAQCTTSNYQWLMLYGTPNRNKWQHSSQNMIINKSCTTALMNEQQHSAQHRIIDNSCTMALLTWMNDGTVHNIWLSITHVPQHSSHEQMTAQCTTSYHKRFLALECLLG